MTGISEWYPNTEQCIQVQITNVLQLLHKIVDFQQNTTVLLRLINMYHTPVLLYATDTHHTTGDDSSRK